MDFVGSAGAPAWRWFRRRTCLALVPQAHLFGVGSAGVPVWRWFRRRTCLAGWADKGTPTEPAKVNLIDSLTGRRLALFRQRGSLATLTVPISGRRLALFRQRKSLRMTSMISTPNQHRILKRISCAVLVLFFWIALIPFASAHASALDQAPTDLILKNDSCDAQNSALEKIQIAQSPEASLKNSAPCLMARIRILSDQKSNEYLVELQINIGNRTWAYFCARYYHAQLGRFISRDPLGFVDGMSLYRGYFVPRSVDPFGSQQLAVSSEREVGNTLPFGLKNFDPFNRPVKNDFDPNSYLGCMDSCLKKGYPKVLDPNIENFHLDWCHETCKGKPGAPDRSVDTRVPYDKFNCAGFAFRNYEPMKKQDVTNYLGTKCKPSNKDEKCTEEGACLKCVYYDIYAVQTFVGRLNMQTMQVDGDFHIVCGMGDGRNSCNKAGVNFPIEGAGPLDSFEPKSQFNGAYEHRPVFTTEYYCCPSE